MAYRFRRDLASVIDRRGELNEQLVVRCELAGRQLRSIRNRCLVSYSTLGQQFDASITSRNNARRASNHRAVVLVADPLRSLGLCAETLLDGALCGRRNFSVERNCHLLGTDELHDQPSSMR